MSDREAHLSEYALARIHAGEASDVHDGHLAACAACRGRLEAIPSKTAELQRSLPVARILARHASRRSPRRTWLMSPRLLVSLALTAACLLLGTVAVLRHAGPAHRGLGGGAGARLKGAYLVEWVVARGGEQRRAEEGFVFKVGDRIGLRVRAPRDAVAQAFSVDARGRVEVLIPAPGSAAPRVVAGQQLVLPSSLELEAPLWPRRLYVVLGARAYRPAELDRAARRASREARGSSDPGRLALPAMLHIDSRWISRGKR